MKPDETYPTALAHFDEVYGRALASGMRDANAMSVATVGADGRPAVRTVLLKAHDERGFEFWLGIEGRLHERVPYRLQDGRWQRGLLYP